MNLELSLDEKREALREAVSAAMARFKFTPASGGSPGRAGRKGR